MGVVERLHLFEHRDQPDSSLFLPLRGNQHSSDQWSRHLTRSTLSDIWHKYATKVGIVGSVPHSARTTFTTEALENGASLGL